jgi:hypothetical protein
MQTLSGIGLADVQPVYDGAEGDLWQLPMGEQIHIGGLSSSMELGDRAGLAEGTGDVDEDRPRLIAEAAHIVRPGGKIAFTGWLAGPQPIQTLAHEGKISQAKIVATKN